MALNQFYKNLPTFLYQQAQDSQELLRGVNMHALRIRITGSVTIAGGTSNGTVVSDSPATLIKSLGVVWDGFDLVQKLEGRDLLALTKRAVAQNVAPVTLANAGAQASTSISCDLIVPFARPWLANPYDTVLPALPVLQQLRLYIQWATDVTTAGSSPGSAAIVSGGDRAVTLSDVQAVVTQIYSTGVAKPWYIPVISVGYAPQFSAANSSHPFQLRGNLRYDSVLIRCMEGASSAFANDINSLRFVAGNQRFIDDIDYEAMKSVERNMFPAVPASSSEPGTLFIMHADGGKLSNAVNPNALRVAGSDPRYEFDVDTPSTAPGQIRVVSFELLTRAGLTQVQD